MEMVKKEHAKQPSDLWSDPKLLLSHPFLVERLTKQPLPHGV